MLRDRSYFIKLFQTMWGLLFVMNCMNSFFQIRPCLLFKVCREFGGFYRDGKQGVSYIQNLNITLQVLNHKLSNRLCICRSDGLGCFHWFGIWLCCSDLLLRLEIKSSLVRSFKGSLLHHTPTACIKAQEIEIE